MMVSFEGERRWLAMSYGFGLLIAVIVGYFLVRIPIQVSDCFSEIVALGQPMADIVRDALLQQGFLRPGRWIQFKIVYELANGHYFWAFRLVHAAHLLVLAWLFVRLLQPRTAMAAMAIPLGFAVLVGGHTFAWTLREAYPINNYLTVVVACAAAANLMFAAPRWWIDALALLLLAVAALTIESGLLVWVILVVGWLVGLRGVSPRGVAAATALVAVYFVVRFAMLDVGLPGLLERESGYGFRRLGGGDLQAIFGDAPLPFYAYNVMSSLIGLLAGEPRNGVFELTAGLLRGAPSAPLVIGAVSSLLATGFVLASMWTRRAAWLGWRFERDDQIVALFWAVFVANGVICYAYTKDVVMSPAGFFYAAAVTVSCVRLLPGASRGTLRALATSVVVFVLSAGWAVRLVGAHAALADVALDVRDQWVYVDEWIATRRFSTPPRVLALKQQLQDDAVIRHPARPLLLERWTRLFEMK